MSLTLVIILVAVLLLLVAIVTFVARQRRSSLLSLNVALTDLAQCLETLLQRGYDLGFVVFQVQGDERFVEFSKYIRDEEHIGLTLDFPMSSWSGPYYEPVKALLDRAGLPYQVEVTPDGPVPEFIQVDFGQDLERGAQVTRDIFQQVFQLPPSIRITAEFEHMSPLRGRVGLAD